MNEEVGLESVAESTGCTDIGATCVLGPLGSVITRTNEIQDSDEEGSTKSNNHNAVDQTLLWPPREDPRRGTAVLQYLSLQAAMMKFCSSPAKLLVTLAYPDEGMLIVECNLCLHSSVYPRITLLDGSHNCSKMMAKHIVKYHPGTMALPLTATSRGTHEEIAEWLTQITTSLFQSVTVNAGAIPPLAPIANCPMGYRILAAEGHTRAVCKANVVMGVLSNAEGSAENIIYTKIQGDGLDTGDEGGLYVWSFTCGVCGSAGDCTVHCCHRFWFADLVRHYYRYHRDTLRVEVLLDAYSKAVKVQAERPGRMQHLIDKGDFYIREVPLSEEIITGADELAAELGWARVNQDAERRAEAAVNLYAMQICAVCEFGDLLFYRHTATQQLGMRCLVCAGESDDDTIQEVESIARGAIEHITSVHYRDLTVMGSWLSENSDLLLEYHTVEDDSFVEQFCEEAQREADWLETMEPAQREELLQLAFVENALIASILNDKKQQGDETECREGEDEDGGNDNTVNLTEVGSDNTVVTTLIQNAKEHAWMMQVLQNRESVERQQVKTVLRTVYSTRLSDEDMAQIMEYAADYGIIETVQEEMPFYGPRGSGTFDQHAASMRNGSLSFHQLQRVVMEATSRIRKVW